MSVPYPQPPVSLEPALRDYLRQFVDANQLRTSNLERNYQPRKRAYELPNVTVAQLTTTAPVYRTTKSGLEVFVTNPSVGNPRPAYSDSVAGLWRFADGTAVV